MSGLFEMLMKCKPGFLSGWLYLLLVVPLLLAGLSVIMAGLWFVSTEMNMM